MATIITLLGLTVAWPVMAQLTVIECKARLDLVQLDLDEIADVAVTGGSDGYSQSDPRAKAAADL